jgi:UDP-glucose 4-epimerase
MGVRVLITGMGGELGTRVAALLEADESIDELCGIDIDPPRRRLRRADFHRVDPRLRHRTIEVVRDFAPTVVVHLGVFEPDARSGPRLATALTASGTVGLFQAITGLGSVEAVVVRSGVEVYGRHRGSAVCPDEGSPTDPSSPYGHALRHVEQVAVDTGAILDVPVACLRLAPVVGPHFPSPLGRLLRLPSVPFSALGDPPFSVVHQQDAAMAFVAAVQRRPNGALNVVAPGAVTAFQAARIGGRIPVPVVGPGWRVARMAAELAGAPVPDHVVELLVRGRGAEGSRGAEILGVHPRATATVVEHLYDWPGVTTVRPLGVAA